MTVLDNPPLLGQDLRIKRSAIEISVTWQNYHMIQTPLLLSKLKRGGKIGKKEASTCDAHCNMVYCRPTRLRLVPRIPTDSPSDVEVYKAIRLRLNIIK